MKDVSLCLLGVLIGLVAGGFLNDLNFYTPFMLSILSGAVAAACSTFLDFSFNEGNIFSSYYRLIETHLNPEHNRHPFILLFKPLGGCLFCMNIWVAAICWSFSAFVFGVEFWVYLLPSIFFSHVFLTISSKYII